MDGCISLDEIKVGDKVRIVDDWSGGCGQELSGLMDKYLGAIVTVSEVGDDYFFIDEDYDDEDLGRISGLNKWYFNEFCVEEIIHIISKDFPVASDEDLISLLS